MNRVDGIQADGTRTISRAGFEVLVLVAIVLINIAELFVWSKLCSSLGLRREPSWAGAFIVPNIIIARLAVDGVLKRLGLSRSGKTFEACSKAALEPEGEAADDETVEVPLAESNRRVLLWATPAMCVFFIVGATFVFDSEPWLRLFCYVFGGLMGLAALNLFWDGKPQAWADRSGITGYPTRNSLRRRSVPWAEVATCEIETVFDTFGKPIVIRPTLRGWDGRPLLTPHLHFTKVEDQERLVKFIKAKLPKPQRDFLD